METSSSNPESEAAYPDAGGGFQSLPCPAPPPSLRQVLDATALQSSQDGGDESPPSGPARRRPEDAPHSSNSADLESVLQSLGEAAGLTFGAENEHQDRLSLARLGIANSLFTAMRAKHAPTAAHGLRVALGCSSWSLLMEITGAQRDAIEIAALLHDIGKIGVPDGVLLKPSPLHGEEIEMMERQRVIGQQILAGFCGSADVLEIVYYAGAWYDGSRGDFDLAGKELPLGARLVAIVDAFDAMTSDHVYRRALPRERALAELYEGAGTQFDPDLVREFCALTAADRVRLDNSVARRWLKEIRADSSNLFWRLGPSMTTDPGRRSGDQLFHSKLIDSMHDGVVFIDSSLRIHEWNRAAERLTGISASAVLELRWSPELVHMQNDDNEEVSEDDCPVSLCLTTGVQALERVSIRDRRGQSRGMNIHLMPVKTSEGALRGVVMLLHDASNQITLEERVESLHIKATQDPLTKIANRAEFDRVLSEFVQTHQEEGLPCSLIICDIDHFKKVNDTYGHPAGDEALVSFANLLQSYTRTGDLVARYGGEEFVLLCADCDHAAATRRAEDVRSRLASLPQPMLGAMSITASFGVTGVQAGDTPETMLARADRALLQAKDSGRNRVVQLGTGVQEPAVPSRRASWWRSLVDAADQNLEKQLVTSVPMKIAVEKLRGFVADHRAQILDVKENVVSLMMIGQGRTRRDGDRSVSFFIGLRFHEIPHKDNSIRTLIDVTIRPKRRRDRRRRDVETKALQVIGSLKAYFVAQECDKQDADVLNKAKHFLNDLLKK